jgi:outer membrane protein TolC
VGNLGGATVVFQPYATTNFNGSLSWPIDIFGIQRKIIDANKAAFEASKLTLLANLNDTHLNVRTAFLSLLRAKAVLQVQEQALKNAKERKLQGDQLLKGGQVAPVDVLRLDTQVAQSETDLISARNNVLLAQNSLNQVLARPIDTPVDVVDTEGLPAVGIPVEQLSAAANVVRPEARAFSDQIEAANRLISVANSGLTPSLSVGLNQSRVLDGRAFGQQSQQTTGTLTLSVPIFDSGITRAKVRQAQQDLETLKVQYEQFLLSVSAEVRSAITNYENSKKKLDAAKHQLELATEVYRISKIRRDAGEGTTLEIVDAQTQLVTAQNGEIQARYDVWTSFAQLQRAIGSDDIDAALDQMKKMKTMTKSKGGAK